MEVTDPDELAVLIVQQFLKEKQYDKALQELERAHGLRYVEEKLPRGSLLLELVYEYLEKRFRGSGDEVAVANAAEEEALLQGGAEDYPCTALHTIAGLHRTNITAICHHPSENVVFTGSGDGTVQAISFAGNEIWALRISHGGAISLATSPKFRKGEAWLLVGSMDGTVSLVDAESGKLLHADKPHAKYVVRVAWSECGRKFASASWDGTISTFEATGGQSSSSENQEAGQFKKLRSIPFPSAVQDLVLLPGGKQLAVALRDTNVLRLRKFPDIHVANDSINMNASGDHHVSFSARQLAVSPDNRFLLVSTDSPRILLLRIQGWTQLKCQIFGLPMDNFHTSVAVWHVSSCYIMAAAAGGQIYVFHVGTGKVVAQLKAHEKNVRWLDYIPKRNLLLSCSFDRTVKIFGLAPEDTTPS